MISVVDTEAPDQSLGDCSICMESIIVSPDHRRRSLSEKSYGSGSDKEKAGGLLGAMQYGMEVAGRTAASKKTWAVAPCHHVFVSVYLLYKLMS